MIHTYKLRGYNIVLDAASGSIHSVDDVAYDVINMYEHNSGHEVIRRMSEKYPDVDEQEINELLSDIEELKNRGKLFSADAFAGIAASKKEKPLKALCLNVSHLCNMNCGYCFAGGSMYRDTGEDGETVHKSSDSKGSGGDVDKRHISSSAKGSGDTGLMSLETGVRAIDFLVENSGSLKNLDVDFFGGEPLLNWGVIKGVVKHARSKEAESGKRFRFTLTTNGLLIDDDVIDFTNKEMHNVVLSLDGRPEIHDALRKLPNGVGSYETVLPKFKMLVQARRGKGYYIRSTFTQDNLDFLSDILHIADTGFTELSMEPVVSKHGEPNGLSTDDLPAICEQYEKLAAEMLARRKEGRGFSFYHYLLDLTGGPCVHKRIAGCGVGTEYLAVTPSGELYPCHQFIGEKRFIMGDVWLGVVDSGLRDEFGACDIYSRDECRVCWARMYCSGGCAANAYHATGSVAGVYELGCEMFKKRMECAIMLKVAAG